jgi:hypothetical protein
MLGVAGYLYGTPSKIIYIQPPIKILARPVANGRKGADCRAFFPATTGTGRM